METPEEQTKPSKIKTFVKNHGRTTLEVTSALAFTVAIIGYREKAQAIADWYADTPKYVNDLETFIQDKDLLDEFHELYMQNELF